MQETQGTQDGRGFFALSSQGGARPVSVAGLAAGDEASAQEGHSVETSAANLAAGGHAGARWRASALAEARPVETSAAGLATVVHEASALAGAHAGETSLMGLATGDEASAQAEAGPVETSAAGLAAVGHEANALAGAHAGGTPVPGLAAGDEASALAGERPVARADPQHLRKQNTHAGLLVQSRVKVADQDARGVKKGSRAPTKPRSMGSCASQPQPLLNYGPGSFKSEASKIRIATRLNQGRAAGRNFQNRVALPMALFSGLLLVALLAMTWFNASACARSGQKAAQCGLSAQFTALVGVAGWVAVTLDLGVGTMMAVDLGLALYNSPDLLSKGMCADIFTHEQQSCVQMSALVIGFFTWFYIGVTGSYNLARMMRDDSLQPRSRLGQIWLLLGTDFLIGACGRH
ncbi:hypothetical protein T492DRAFT_885829, partial [Pavlovales sp. CCMP2436]